MRQYWLVGLLVLMAVWMAVVRFRYRNYQWPTPQVIIEPTPSVTKAPESEDYYPLKGVLPYKGNGYLVEGYVEPLKLSIRTEGKVTEKIKESIFEWMTKNKVATESHQLLFNIKVYPTE